MPLKIKYNTNVIKEFEEGQTATIKCENAIMETDLIIEYKAEEETPTIPTDLTGYTISWTGDLSSNLTDGDSFNLNFTCNNKEFSTLSFQLAGSGMFVATVLYYDDVDIYNFMNETWNNEYYLSPLYVTGGTHSTNTELIQWFANNGATFTKTEGGTE